jgi:putative transposase
MPRAAPRTDLPTRETLLRALVGQPARRQAEAVARLAAINLLATHRPHHASLDAALRAATSAWPTTASADDLAVLPSFSAMSLRRWATAAEAGDLGPLLGRGQRRAAQSTRQIDIDPSLHDALEATLAAHPTANSLNLLRALEVRHPGPYPSLRSLRRWIAAWKARRPALHATMVNPDRARGSFRVAFGREAEVAGPNARWEIDGTPGDVMLSDGRRHAVIGIIDVWTRRMVLHVARGETAAAALAAVRRAILAWGVPAEIVSDNGAGFVSHHMRQALTALGIAQRVLPPFQPERKPFIESAFRTFSHQLVELLPGYIGHDVAEREGIRSRETFAQRLFGKGKTDAPLPLDADGFQGVCDAWTQLYHRTGHSGLRGATPEARTAAWAGQVARITDERALDLLLLPPADGDGWRTVAKTGLRVGGGTFVSPGLATRVGERVRVLLSEDDAGRVVVFDEAGEFVCVAEDPERTGISRQAIAAEARQRQAAHLAEAKAELRRLKRSHRTEGHQLVRDIVARAASEREADPVVAFPRPAMPHTSPALREAGIAARADDAPTAPPRQGDDALRLQRLEEAARRTATAQPASADQAWADKRARIARATAIETALAEGTADPGDRAWFDRYRRGPEWQAAQALAGGSRKTG